MVLYYFNKYNLNITKEVQISNNVTYFAPQFLTTLNSIVNYYKYFSFNKATGFFVVSTPDIRYKGQSPAIGHAVILLGSNSTIQELGVVLSETYSLSGVSYQRINHHTITSSYSKGDFLEEVLIAEENYYPINGFSGNNWYVRGDVAWIPPNLKTNINGQLKEYADGWVKIDGQLRQIDKMWTKVNGILREV